jgi:hypothetical protein
MSFRGSSGGGQVTLSEKCALLFLSAELAVRTDVRGRLQGSFFERKIGHEHDLPCSMRRKSRSSEPDVSVRQGSGVRPQEETTTW